MRISCHKQMITGPGAALPRALFCGDGAPCPLPCRRRRSLPVKATPEFDNRPILPHYGGMFAVLSVWIALGALVMSIITIFRPDRSADLVVTLLQYTIALSATLAACVLWWLRTREADEPGVSGQRLQAIVALVINSLTFAILLFALLDPLQALLAMVIEYTFLYTCWLLYARIVLQKPR